MPESRDFTTKKELRRTMKIRNLALGEELRKQASGRIFAAVERLPAFARARCVAAFCSLDDEPDTRAFLTRWSASKRIVVPRVEGERMQFYDYDPSALCAGAFGIDEPQVAVRSCEPSQIDLVVVPGVAFTASGDRMGRGRGYYDKYLSQSGMRAVRVGVCYAHQLVGGLFVEPHDMKMDFVCTEE